MKTFGIVLLMAALFGGAYLAFHRVSTGPERRPASSGAAEASADPEPGRVTLTDAPSGPGGEAAASEASVVDVRLEGTAGDSTSDEVDIALVLSIDDGWHVNANPASDEYLIPTEVVLADDAPAKIVRVDYPPPAERKSFSYSENPVDVYSGEVRIPVRLSFTEDSGKPVSLLVTYQPCDDSRCLAPNTVTITLARP